MTLYRHGLEIDIDIGIGLGMVRVHARWGGMGWDHADKACGASGDGNQHVFPCTARAGLWCRQRRNSSLWICRHAQSMTSLKLHRHHHHHHHHASYLVIIVNASVGLANIDQAQTCFINSLIFSENKSLFHALFQCSTNIDGRMFNNQHITAFQVFFSNVNKLIHRSINSADWNSTHKIQSEALLGLEFWQYTELAETLTS